MGDYCKHGYSKAQLQQRLCVDCDRAGYEATLTTLRAQLAEATRRAEAAEVVLRDAKRVMSDCAAHAGYVVGGDDAVVAVRSKWPPCETCVSAADHYAHCKSVCERIDATLDPKGVK